MPCVGERIPISSCLWFCDPI